MNSSKEYSGLYTYIHTTKSDTKIKNLVRVDLDTGTKNILKFPYLMIGDKKYKNLVIHLDPPKGNLISGYNKKHNIKIGGVFYVDKDKKVGLQLALNMDKINKMVSANPDKILKNISIKVSSLSKGDKPSPSPGPSPSPSPGPGKKRYSCNPDTGRCYLDPNGKYKTKKECISNCKINPVPVGPEDPIDPEDPGSWSPIIPINPPVPPTPDPKPIGPDPDDPDKPNNPIPSVDPNNLTPQDILNQIEKNQINGNNNLNNQCPPMYPYAYGSTIEGQGPKCCIGKPMQPLTEGGIYTCGDDDGSCGGTCAGMTVDCKEGQNCINHQNVTNHNMCPIDHPYPFTYYLAKNAGEKGKPLQRWGGRGYFCCKTDPGPNNECGSNDIVTCPRPECRQNDIGISDIEFVNSILCSQKINNFKQIPSNNPLVKTTLNPDGLMIDTSKYDKFSSLQYITYSKKPLLNKDSKSQSSEYILQNTPKKNNNKILLKLKENFGLKNKISFYIDDLYFNYLKGLRKNSKIYITPTAEDLSTCESNNKPLYEVSPQSYGRNFSWEWEQMGGKYIDPIFIKNNINLGGSFDGKTSSEKGNNNTLQSIIDRNSPYIIYKNTQSDQLYYYDMTKNPIDCSTPENCSKTCSGYSNYKAGDTSVAEKYFYQCSDGGMYCSADGNLSGSIRDCKGTSRNFAVPLPYCASTVNTTQYKYPYDNGASCAAQPYNATYGILTENSLESINNETSIPCLNPPCCPYSHKEAYEYQIPNSDKTIRLCYNKDDGKQFSCSPTTGVDNFPLCSNPFIPNKKYDGDKKIKTIPNLNSIEECRKECANNSDCGLYQFRKQDNSSTCDLFPLITPSTLDDNSSVEKGSVLGFNFGKGDWLMNRTFNVNNNYYKAFNNVNNNVQGCYNACIIDDKCNGFTLDNSTCSLYNSTPEVPANSTGTISMKISNEGIEYRKRNYFLNDIPNTVQIAKNTVNENFTSAINTVKLNKITENYDNQFNMTNNNAKDINNNCKPLGDGSLPDGCSDKVKTIYGYQPIKDTPNFNKLACPADYPIAVNGGTQCTKPKSDSSVRLNPKDGRGIKVGDKDNTINCGKNKGDKCGNYTAKKIRTYTRNGYTMDHNNKQVRGCLIDNNMIEAGYILDDKDLACNSGKQCIGYAHDIINGNIIGNTSSLGYCSDDKKLEKFTYNQSRSGTVLEKSSQVSPDYCAYACKQKAECIAFNFDPRIPDNNCTLLSSAVSLTPSGNKGSPGVITSLNIPGYSSTSQTACETQLNNLPNVSDVHYIGNNKDANALFNAYTQLPKVCQQWNSATWFSTEENSCSNKEDGSFVKNCNMMIECKGGKFGNSIDRPQTVINGKTDEDMIADKIGILGACNIAGINGIHTNPTGGGCYGGINNGDFKVLPFKKGYKIDRHEWTTTKLNDPNINGYCAYKT